MHWPMEIRDAIVSRVLHCWCFMVCTPPIPWLPTEAIEQRTNEAVRCGRSCVYKNKSPSQSYHSFKALTRKEGSFSRDTSRCIIYVMPLSPQANETADRQSNDARISCARSRPKTNSRVFVRETGADLWSNDSRTFCERSLAQKQEKSSSSPLLFQSIHVFFFL